MLILKYRNILLNSIISNIVEIPIFECEHLPKKHLVKYRCYNGNYSLKLCSNCYQNESDEFVIKEEILS